MEDLYNTISIPSDACKEIKWYLKNYYNLDEKIMEREKELEDSNSDYYRYSNSNYLKSIKDDGNTLENTVIERDSDLKLTKYKKWKKVISIFLADILTENDRLKLDIVRLKFWKKLNNQEIIKYLNISKEGFKVEIFFILYDLYVLGIEEKIFEEVEV